jgi:ABC-type uncharacterized transport system ATPase subunit
MPVIIETNQLVKEYQRYEKEEGFMGSLRSLFKRKND